MLSLFGEENNFENQNADSKIRSWTELITPERANFLLSNSSLNRKIGPAHVRKLADLMKKGLWIQDAEPLLFDNQDRLIEGHHRLHAVIKSKTTQSFAIMSGFKPDVMAVLDTGKPRTTADTAQLCGLSDATKSHVGCLNHMSLPKITHLHATQIRVELLKKYFSAIKFACNYRPEKNERIENPLPTPIKALIAKAYYYESPEILTRFMKAYTTGFTDKEEERAAIALLNYVKKVDGRTLKENSEIYRVGQHALHLFISRKAIKRLHATNDGEDRYPLPGFYEMSEEDIRRYNRWAYRQYRE